MSGFGAMKKQEKKSLEEAIVNGEEPSSGAISELPPVVNDTFSSLRAELEQLAQPQRKIGYFCGVVGHENTGKTGAVMDAHMSNNENDNMMWVLDFDSGAGACKSAHYGNTPAIRIWNPFVMQTENRTAYDYPATHQRVMDICMFAVEQAQKQNEEGYSGPLLSNFMVTALDLFDQVCVNNMKIYDLDTGAKDAIDASNNAFKVGNQWNWSIRSTRFHQLTALCRQLVNLGVNVFWETHLAPEVFHDSTTGSWRPKWEKQTDNILHQILWFKRDKVRDADGRETGETRYNVEFRKCKTNPNLQGQERTIFVTKKGESHEWYGLPELRDGIL